MNMEIKRKKDRECAECRFLFECMGKPEHVKQCLYFKQYREEKKNGD